MTFKLNNDRLDDRTGCELGAKIQQIGPDQVEQTLKFFLKGIAERKGLEKNLWGKKFIHKIIYSKDQIELTLCCSKTSSARAFEALPSGQRPDKNFNYLPVPLKNASKKRFETKNMATPPGFEPGLSDRKSEVLGLWTMGSQLQPKA